jgi:hypothetical protein
MDNATPGKSDLAPALRGARRGDFNFDLLLTSDPDRRRTHRRQRPARGRHLVAGAAGVPSRLRALEKGEPPMRSMLDSTLPWWMAGPVLSE